MAAASPWSTTVIMSASLQKHDICQVLCSQHRVRFSESVDAGVFILPISGTAFLLIDPQDFPEPFEESRLAERLHKFVEVHRNCFLLFFAPFNGNKERRLLSLIQRRFCGSNLRILPVRNGAEAVKGMLTVAKAASRPFVDRILERMSLARAHIIETSPVWEVLKNAL